MSSARRTSSVSSLLSLSIYQQFALVECMKLEPSDFGNGIFVACFKVHSHEEEEDDEGDDEEGDGVEGSKSSISLKKKRGRKRKQRARFEESNDALSSSMSLSSKYASNPSRGNGQQKSGDNRGVAIADLTIYGFNVGKISSKKGATSRSELPIKREIEPMWKYPVPNPQPWK